MRDEELLSFGFTVIKEMNHPIIGPGVPGQDEGIYLEKRSLRFTGITDKSLYSIS